MELTAVDRGLDCFQQTIDFFQVSFFQENSEDTDINVGEHGGLEFLTVTVSQFGHHYHLSELADF